MPGEVGLPASASCGFPYCAVALVGRGRYLTHLIPVPVTGIQQPRVHAAEDSCSRGKLPVLANARRSSRLPLSWHEASGLFFRSLFGLQTQAGCIPVTGTGMRWVREAARPINAPIPGKGLAGESRWHSPCLVPARRMSLKWRKGRLAIRCLARPYCAVALVGRGPPQPPHPCACHRDPAAACPRGGRLLFLRQARSVGEYGGEQPAILPPGMRRAVCSSGVSSACRRKSAGGLSLQLRARRHGRSRSGFLPRPVFSFLRSLP